MRRKLLTYAEKNLVPKLASQLFGLRVIGLQHQQSLDLGQQVMRALLSDSLANLARDLEQLGFLGNQRREQLIGGWRSDSFRQGLEPLHSPLIGAGSQTLAGLIDPLLKLARELAALSGELVQHVQCLAGEPVEAGIFRNGDAV